MGSTQIYFYRFYNRILLGRRVPVKILKRFSIIFNVSIKYKKEGTYVRSSGTYATIITNFFDLNLSKISLPSKKKYLISGSCFVTLGRNSNIFKKNQILGSAKNKRFLGKKSLVRGVAMNPVDHPHGGRTKTNSP